MLKLLICIGVSLVYASIATYYVYKKKFGNWLALAISMTVLLMLIAFIQYFIGSQISVINALEPLTACAICFPAAWADAKERKIPNEVLLVGLGLRVILYFIQLFISTSVLVETLKQDGLGLILIGVFCGVSCLIIREGMGMGDVKLLLIIALFMGLDGSIATLFFSMIVALFMGLYALIIKKAGKKATIPFAPAILAGIYIVTFLNIFE